MANGRGSDSLCARCFCCLPCEPFSGWRRQRDDELSGGELQSRVTLPGSFEEMLANGQMLAALLLSTVFSEKYKGRTMQPGAVADINLPSVGVQRPKLFARTGHLEAVPFIWCGDESVGDCTLYVAFSPLRRKRQFVKVIFTRGKKLVDDSVQVPGGGVQSFRVSEYIKEKLDHLWSEKYRFGELLAQAVAAYPRHRIVFAGISHGAVLAQAAALRFCLLDPASAPRVNVVSWNAYKWTDAAGSALAGRVLRDRLLPLVLSRGNPRRWDAVAEYPSAVLGFEPMPNVVLLDCDTGVFFGNVSLARNSLGFEGAGRMSELHFAKTALPAVKVAMARSQSGIGARARLHWKTAMTSARALVALSEPLRASPESRELPGLGVSPATSLATPVALMNELPDSEGDDTETDDGSESISATGTTAASLRPSLGSVDIR